MAKKTNWSVHLFNCDDTFALDSVESLFSEVRGELDFDISIEKHTFRLSQMSVMSDNTVPGLKMDLAVFVVHAHESRLSINEDNAGIGYAKIYRALKQATGGLFECKTTDYKLSLVYDTYFARFSIPPRDYKRML